MTIGFYMLFLLAIILTIFLVFCLRRISKLVLFQEELNKRVEDSLDILDSAYRDIALVAGTDVASDDIFVRRVVTSVSTARDAVHKVAEKLASFDEIAVVVEKTKT